MSTSQGTRRIDGIAYSYCTLIYCTRHATPHSIESITALLVHFVFA